MIYEFDERALEATELALYRMNPVVKARFGTTEAFSRFIVSETKYMAPNSYWGTCGFTVSVARAGKNKLFCKPSLDAEIVNMLLNAQAA